MVLLSNGNYEEKPVGSSSSIVNARESAYYNIATASDVSSYQFMQNTSVPIDFPADVSTFIAGHLYSFMYNGTNLTLLADRLLSIDSALADVLPFPTGITAQALSASSICISWNAVSKASGYNVYRSSSEEGTYSKVNAELIPGNNYTDTELMFGTTYYYKLASVGANGRESQKSGPVEETTPTVSLSVICYVSSNGSDASNGTAPETPFATVTKALERIKVGYSDGDYLESGISKTAIIIISGTIPETPKTNGMIEITGVNAYPPIVLRGKSDTEKGILNANRLKRVLYVNSNKVTLETNLTLMGGNGTYGSGVYVGSSGTFTMSGGEISGNTSTNTGVANNSNGAGGGVYVNGTFTMSDGDISGNTSTNTGTGYGYGGGVHVSSSGTFTMSGGNISGNTSRTIGTDYGGIGGGVYVGGTFTMSDGEISGNTGTNSGGGVYVGSGTFTMLGGDISDNASTYGGGVDVGDTFTMSDGKISGNTSCYGGGMYVGGYGIFKKTSGIIYGDTDTTHTSGSTENTASSNGHAVYVSTDPIKKRNSTAGTEVNLDSMMSGSAGGWE
jgi:hypothetical protein